MTVQGPGDILRASAARFGDAVALVSMSRTLTFTDLDAESDRVAAGLAARGVEPGNTVSLYARNRWEWVVAYHGALKAGAVVNPVNVMLTPEELAALRGRSRTLEGPIRPSLHYAIPIWLSSRNLLPHLKRSTTKKLP